MLAQSPPILVLALSPLPRRRLFFYSPSHSSALANKPGRTNQPYTLPQRLDRKGMFCPFKVGNGVQGVLGQP